MENTLGFRSTTEEVKHLIMMFMGTEEQKQAIGEAARVLENDGLLHIWDCDIASAYPEPFCVDVEIQLPTEHISTTYGIGKADAQDRDTIAQMCRDAGLLLVAESAGSDGFYLCYEKKI